MNGPLARALAGWERFWFEPQQTSTLALFRIAFGLVVTAWTLTLGPDLFAFHGPDAILPIELRTDDVGWGLLAFSDSRSVVVGLWAATLLASIALTLGWHSRLAAIMVFVGIISFERDNWLVLNSGDGLLRVLAFYLMLAPSGAALSLDRRRTAPGRFWEFPARAPWALRLVQIQLSVLYLATVWHKMQGEQWRDGTAVSYALRMEDITRFGAPAFVTDSVLLTEWLTFGTIALELSLGVLVWNRALRPWVLGLGVSLHLGIDLSLLIGFFSFTILTAYLAFVPAATASRAILAARDRFGRRPASAPPAQPPPAQPLGVEPPIPDLVIPAPAAPKVHVFTAADSALKPARRA